MKRVLVTGNLGFVGTHVTKILLNQGHFVMGCDLDLFPTQNLKNSATPHVQIKKDFRTLTLDDLKNIDSIVHLAAISNDPMGEIDEGLTFDINGRGTEVLATKARGAGIRNFIFASSCSIYGSGGDVARTESDQVNPLSEYASSKVHAENALKSLATEEFSVYLLRNSTAGGASQNFRADLVVNDLSSQMHAFSTATIKSDGEPWRPLIDSHDMARVLVKFALSNPVEVSGQPINIGWNSENFKIKQVGKLVDECWPLGNVSIGNMNNPDPRNYRVDFSFFNSIFPELKPKFPLVASLKNLRLFYDEIGLSRLDIESKRFIRLEYIKNKIDILKL